MTASDDRPANGPPPGERRPRVPHAPSGGDGPPDLFFGADTAVKRTGPSVPAIAGLVVSVLAVLVALAAFVVPAVKAEVPLLGAWGLLALGSAGARATWRDATTSRRALTCPSCRKEFTLSVRAAGWKKCPACSIQARIPRDAGRRR